MKVDLLCRSGEIFITWIGVLQKVRLLEESRTADPRTQDDVNRLLGRDVSACAREQREGVP